MSISCEVAVVNGSLSTTQRDSIEGDLKEPFVVIKED